MSKTPNTLFYRYSYPLTRHCTCKRNKNEYAKLTPSTLCLNSLNDTELRTLHGFYVNSVNEAL